MSSSFEDTVLDFDLNFLHQPANNPMVSFRLSHTLCESLMYFATINNKCFTIMCYLYTYIEYDLSRKCSCFAYL